MSAQFRKKPVVIDAVTWYGKYTDGTEWPEWFREAVFVGKIVPTDAKVLLIHTLEGTMSAISGDYIIRGVAGEIYPCKPDIFAATYEAVNALAATEQKEKA